MVRMNAPIDWSPKRDLKKFDGMLWPACAEPYRSRYVRHAPDMRQAIKYCRKTDVVIQAGGHVGVWSRWLADNTKFRAIYTFEPDAMNFYCLARNCWEPKIRKFQAALGDTGSEPVGMNFHQNNIGAHNVEGQGDFPVMAIDSLNLRECDLMVLDVEGHELPALKGAEETLKQFGPVLQLEDRGHGEKYGFERPGELKEYLEGLGYRETDRVAKDAIWTVN